jgi:Cu+-exporting ATPase
MESLDTTIKGTPKKTIDPVCGMDVEPGRSKLGTSHEGRSYWFCAEGCRKTFEANPRKYLKSKSSKNKGWFGRWLDSMGKANEKEFGSAGPKCCP